MIDLTQRYSHQDITNSLQELSRRHSEFVIFRKIGVSQDEREICMLRVGTGTKTLVVSAGIHGRESVNPIIMLRMIEDYCNVYWNAGYLGQYNVRQLLNNFSILFIPLMNPDGYEIALNGFSAIHNPVLRQLCRMKNISHESWKYNARGVDINRNFPCKSYVQQQLCEYPASETETQALIQIFNDYETLAYLDFHSRGKIIYYYRNAMSFSYNQRSQRLAKYLQKLSKYSLGRKEEEFMSQLNGGNSVNYYSEMTGRPAITIETVKDEASFPLNLSYQQEAYEEIYQIPLEVLSHCNPQ